MPLRLADEVALIVALQTGLLDHVPLEKIAAFRSRLPAWLDQTVAALVEELERSGLLDDSGRARLREALAGLADELAGAPRPGAAQEPP